jgi:hypothetical protein
MSEKLDQFAQELLEKTRTNKLDWQIMANSVGRDEFSADLGEGYRFHIWSVLSGENRSITLQLWKDERPVLESVANNWAGLLDINIQKERVKRFRAYSDLFDAVRESVYGGEQTMGEVAQLLRRIV